MVNGKWNRVTSSSGAIIRHGPHQGAHMSSNTGSGDCSTSAAKLASVTVSGLLERDRGFLQRPQTGSFPCSVFSRSTRLFAPHDGQRITCVLGISFNPLDNFRRGRDILALFG